MNNHPLVSIIIINYCSYNYTAKCIRSVQSVLHSDAYELIVIDNASDDGSAEKLRKQFANIIVHREENNRGFGSANNVGAKLAKGEYLFFLNNDTELIEDCITPLINILQHQPKVGIVAPKLLYPNGAFQLSYGKFPGLYNEWKTKKKKENSIVSPISEIQVDWVSGAAFCISKNLFTDVAGFDEEFFMYFEDIDLCKKVYQKEYQILYVPTVSLIHYKGKSRRNINDRILYEYRKSQLHYYKKHCSVTQQVLLRCYLLLKYSVLAITKKSPISSSVLKLVLSY